MIEPEEKPEEKREKKNITPEVAPPGLLFDNTPLDGTAPKRIKTSCVRSNRRKLPDNSPSLFDFTPDPLRQADVILGSTLSQAQLPTISTAPQLLGVKEDIVVHGLSGILNAAAFESRDYQIDELAAFRSHTGPHVTVIDTGKGKTPLVIWASGEYLRENKTVLILCHSKDMVTQWHDEYKRFTFLDENEIGTVCGDNLSERCRELYRNDSLRVLIGTGHSIWQDHFKSRVDLKSFGLIVWDEGQLITGDHPYAKIAEVVRESTIRKLIVSATPSGVKEDENLSAAIKNKFECLFPGVVPSIPQSPEHQKSFKPIIVQLTPRICQRAHQLETMMGWCLHSLIQTVDPQSPIQNRLSIAIQDLDERGFPPTKETMDLLNDYRKTLDKKSIASNRIYNNSYLLDFLKRQHSYVYNFGEFMLLDSSGRRMVAAFLEKFPVVKNDAVFPFGQKEDPAKPFRILRGCSYLEPLKIMFEDMYREASADTPYEYILKSRSRSAHFNFDSFAWNAASINPHETKLTSLNFKKLSKNSVTDQAKLDNAEPEDPVNFPGLGPNEVAIYPTFQSAIEPIFTEMRSHLARSGFISHPADLAIIDTLFKYCGDNSNQRAIIDSRWGEQALYDAELLSHRTGIVVRPYAGSSFVKAKDRQSNLAGFEAGTVRVMTGTSALYKGLNTKAQILIKRMRPDSVEDERQLEGRIGRGNNSTELGIVFNIYIKDPNHSFNTNSLKHSIAQYRHGRWDRAKLKSTRLREDTEDNLPF